MKTTTTTYTNAATTKTTPPQRTAYDVLGDWTRIYHLYGEHLDSIDVFFESYAEDEYGEANKDYLCYSIHIHRRSVEEDFEIGERSRFIYLVYTQPEVAASFYVWLTAEGELDTVSDIDPECAWVEDVILALDARNPVDWLNEDDALMDE